MICRFDEVWEKAIQINLERSKPSTKEQKDAICKKLHERTSNSKYPQDKFFNYEDEHREFRIDGIDCVVQMRQLPDSDEYEINNLWFFYRGDDHPDWLIIKFKTVKERERFAKIAQILNQDDEYLGEQLIIDFMNKFDKFYNI